MRTLSPKKQRIADYLLATAETTGVNLKKLADDVGMFTVLMATMVNIEEPKQAQKMVDSIKMTVTEVDAKDEMPDMEHYATICLLVNWLSWAHYEVGDEAMAKAWADAWYDIHNFNLDTLKGDNLKEYIERVD